MLSTTLPDMFLPGIIFILTGALACWFAFWSNHMNKQAATWPGAEGIIIESRMKWSSRYRTTYIRYQFTVNGRTFDSHQFSYISTNSFDLGAYRLRLTQYPVGRRVTVYYDPNNPNRAVLEFGESNGWIGVIVIGLIFVGVGLRMMSE